MKNNINGACCDKDVVATTSTQHKLLSSNTDYNVN